jgi:hypothetical protein
VNNINTRERITLGEDTWKRIEIKEEINGTPEYTKSLTKAGRSFRWEKFASVIVVMPRTL